MAEFHFLRPEMLLALAPLALVWWLLWRMQDAYAGLRELVAPHLLEHLVVDEGRKGALRPLHLLAVIWVLSALALAGPTWEREPSPFADDDAGLVVLLKVSGTMEATDVQPSRLARAKHKLRDLLALRKGSATGLIVYSGSAHLVMPLTRDERIVAAMVEDLTPALMPVDGDALADALRMAEALLARAGVPGSALVLADGVALLAVGPLDAGQQLGEGRQSVALLFGEVGPGEERPLVLRRQEHRERPAAGSARQQLVRGLVDAVQVRALLPVHLDVDEKPVHHRRRLRVLEGFVRHHVAPVAGRVADRQQHWAIRPARFLECFVAPRIPVHRVVPVLQEIGARFVGQSISHRFRVRAAL